MRNFVYGLIIGIIAGIVVEALTGVVRGTVNGIRNRRDRGRIRQWLADNTNDQGGFEYRSARAIASATNLSEQRVTQLCSADNEIHLSTGSRDGMWRLAK